MWARGVRENKKREKEKYLNPSKKPRKKSESAEWGDTTKGGKTKFKEKREKEKSEEVSNQYPTLYGAFMGLANPILGSISETKIS